MPRGAEMRKQAPDSVNRDRNPNCLSKGNLATSISFNVRTY